MVDANRANAWDCAGASTASSGCVTCIMTFKVCDSTNRTSESGKSFRRCKDESRPGLVIHTLPTSRFTKLVVLYSILGLRNVPALYKIVVTPTDGLQNSRAGFMGFIIKQGKYSPKIGYLVKLEL